MEIYRNYINGRWVESTAERFLENKNPANTDEVLGLMPLSSRDEARAAIRAAVEAFDKWRRVTAPARGSYVARAAEAMRRRKEELAEALTREEGKTLRESLGEVQRSINILEFMAGEGRRLGGETLYSELPNNFIYTVKYPIGPVAIITPWNFPVAIPCWKIAPAIVAGNTVVFKPASYTPLTAKIVVELFEEAGVPPGVINLVYGSGGTVGEEMINNPAVRAISFTGSNEVGSHIQAQGALRMTKVQCEMGGKNPVVVLEDADLELAVEGIVQGAFGSTGQRCTATSRVIVEQSIADQLVEKLVDKTRRLRVGNGLQPNVDVGPSVDASQMHTVLEYIDIGKKEGARLLCGGSRLSGPEHDKGYFVAPTIFDNVSPEMRIAQEEIFGPVLSIMRARDLEQALALANRVRYGLSASIYTNNAAAIFQFVDEIEVGVIHINSPTVGGEAHVPFGGIKATGMGWREMGRAAVDFYTEVKTVYIDYTGRKRETNIY